MGPGGGGKLAYAGGRDGHRYERREDSRKPPLGGQDESPKWGRFLPLLAVATNDPLRHIHSLPD